MMVAEMPASDFGDIRPQDLETNRMEIYCPIENGRGKVILYVTIVFWPWLTVRTHLHRRHAHRHLLTVPADRATGITT